MQLGTEGLNSNMNNQSRNRDNRRNQGPKEEKQYDERVVHIDRVARVVKGGRRFRFRALIVLGDHKGKVGIGISKGADVSTAVNKATESAKKSVTKINLYKDTIPHEVESKVGGARIMLKPASSGTGLIAGGAVRTVLEVAGVKNCLSKSLGSSNKVNTVYATLTALLATEPASKWITRATSEPVKKDKTGPKTVKTKSKKGSK